MQDFEKLKSGEYEERVYCIAKSVGAEWATVLKFTSPTDKKGAIIGIALNNDVAYIWDIKVEEKTVFPMEGGMDSRAMEGNMKEVDFFIPIPPGKTVTFVAKSTATVDVKLRLRVRYWPS